MTFPLTKRLAAECLGTGLLVATVVGSGIMGEKLAGGSQALALLGNTLPTGAILVVLILTLGPISGAHFNPAVSWSWDCAESIPGASSSLIWPPNRRWLSRNAGRT
jgi:glycerol uptake facilitator-like aquaporin